MRQFNLAPDLASQIQLLAKENDVAPRDMAEYLIRHALESTPAAKKSRHLGALKGIAAIKGEVA